MPGKSFTYSSLSDEYKLVRPCHLNAFRTIIKIRSKPGYSKLFRSYTKLKYLAYSLSVIQYRTNCLQTETKLRQNVINEIKLTTNCSVETSLSFLFTLFTNLSKISIRESYMQSSVQGKNFTLLLLCAVLNID